MGGGRDEETDGRPRADREQQPRHPFAAHGPGRPAGPPSPYSPSAVREPVTGAPARPGPVGGYRQGGGDRQGGGYGQGGGYRQLGGYGQPGGRGPLGGPPRRRTTRRLLVVVGTLVALVAGTVGAAAVLQARRGGGQSPAPGLRAAPAVTGSASAAAAAPTVAPRLGWLSGASSTPASDGTFAAWRGEPVTIGGTWDNGDVEQVQMYSICSGDWTTWDKPLDVAIGAIDVTRGETWAAAARGAYDARWTQNLEQIKQCWGSRNPALLYIRFAHEMNLDTSSWRVEGGEEGDFVKAITRYSNLRYKILPGANIVLCPNDGTSPDMNGLDIRKLWPGKDSQGREIANVYAVDSYNMDPHVTTQADFNDKINGELPGGIPLGLEKHREFAASVGVPFAIPEWANDGDPGDGGGESPLYIRAFFQWVAAHAGDINHPQPGQVLYEVEFNLETQYAFWPSTDQPRTAAAYRALKWGSIGG